MRYIRGTRLKGILVVGDPHSLDNQLDIFKRAIYIPKIQAVS